MRNVFWYVFDYIIGATQFIPGNPIYILSNPDLASDFSMHDHAALLTSF